MRLGPLVAKQLVLFFIAVSLCSSVHGGEAPSEKKTFLIKIANKWLTLDEIDKRATEYVQQKDKEFDRAKETMSIWVDPSSEGKTVLVFFGNGIGKKGWRVLFSRSGKVTEYTSNLMGG